MRCKERFRCREIVSESYQSVDICSFAYFEIRICYDNFLLWAISPLKLCDQRPLDWSAQPKLVMMKRALNNSESPTFFPVPGLLLPKKIFQHSRKLSMMSRKITLVHTGRLLLRRFAQFTSWSKMRTAKLSWILCRPDDPEMKPSFRSRQ